MDKAMERLRKALDKLDNTRPIGLEWESALSKVVGAADAVLRQYDRAQRRQAKAADG